MFQINLLYEQQELQRQRDYDPVKLTILGGIVIFLGIALWVMSLYISMGSLRKELSSNQAELAKKEDEFKKLGNLTDLAKISNQAQALRTRSEYRVLMATQLDILRDTIPTNCQIRSLKTARLMNSFDEFTEIPDKENPGKKKKIPVKKIAPGLEMAIVVATSGKSSVEVHQVGDSLEEKLRLEPRFREWLRQIRDENTNNTNTWNDVERVSRRVIEPKGGEGEAGSGADLYEGEFQFKMPFALKDLPKEIK